MARRRLLHAALLGLLTLGVMEAAAWGLYGLATRHPFSFHAVHAEQARLLAPSEPAGRQGRPFAYEAIHPYLGYVLNPDFSGTGTTVGPAGVRVSRFGFLDDKQPVQTRAPGRIIVGVTGGSVAFYLLRDGMEALMQELQKVPQFARRDVVVVRLAMAGYKQPQQLMTLAYLLSLGAQFDILINVDGFNEVALPRSENVAHGVFPFFPRSWHLRIYALGTPQAVPLLAKIHALRQVRAWLAEGLSAGPLRYSVTASLLWIQLDSLLKGSLWAQERMLAVAKADRPDYAITGPDFAPTEEAALYRALAENWRQSSLLMDQLSRANGIAYVHVLQPNQYVPGSKPMGPAERAVAYNTTQPYRRGVEQGYPFLRQAGHALRRDGVRFHDLTQIFADEPASLYIDDCCHFSPDAARRFGRRIGELMRDDLAGPS